MSNFKEGVSLRKGLNRYFKKYFPQQNFTESDTEFKALERLVNKHLKEANREKQELLTIIVDRNREIQELKADSNSNKTWCKEVEGKSIMFQTFAQASGIAELAKKLGYSEFGPNLSGAYDQVYFCDDGDFVYTLSGKNDELIDVYDLQEIVERWDNTNKI